MSKRLLRFPEVQARVGGYTREWLGRLEKQGKFPRRIKINGSSRQGGVAWAEDEIDAWVKAKMQGREQETAGLQGGGDGRGHVAA